MSLSASAGSHSPVTALAYLDVVIVALATPIVLLMGVPAAGYLVGAGAWIVLRVVGVGVERLAPSLGDQNREVSVRLAYLLGRLFLLAIAVILVRQGSGRDAGLTALLVIVFAFTTQLVLSIANRPSSSARRSR
jgi:hypothetical protein